MEQAMLKKLVKKELLHGIWLEVDKLVSKFSNSNRTKFGQEISGNHSWYSGASNDGEDIQLSSLVRIFGQLEASQDGKASFDNIFTEKVLRKGRLLNYLTSTKEMESYLPEIIKQNVDLFKEIKNNLAPLYRENRLGSNEMAQAYRELTEILRGNGEWKE